LYQSARVGVVTVHQLEAEASQPRPATLDVIRRTFESAGVEFIPRERRRSGRPPTQSPAEKAIEVAILSVKVGIEPSLPTLSVLAYNIIRTINLVGAATLRTSLV